MGPRGSSVCRIDQIAATVLTVGHSTHEAEAFTALLRRHGVEALADVRRYPGSRRVPWTNEDAIGPLLAACAIEYAHLPELGGRRRPRSDSPNGGWDSEQFRGYADHMESEEFAAGLGRLVELVGAHRTALMCAEAQWWRCHRRLIADALAARGWQVVHVGARGDLQPHPQGLVA